MLSFLVPFDWLSFGAGDGLLFAHARAFGGSANEAFLYSTDSPLTFLDVRSVVAVF